MVSITIVTGKTTEKVNNFFVRFGCDMNEFRCLELTHSFEATDLLFSDYGLKMDEILSSMSVVECHKIIWDMTTEWHEYNKIIDILHNYVINQMFDKDESMIQLGMDLFHFFAQ